MKKLITLSTICIITSLLFSSCKSNMSVTKRHYNKGYYIAHSKGKQTVTAPKEEKVVQMKTRNTLYSVQNLPNQNIINGYSNPSPVVNNTVITASNEKNQSKVVSQKNTKQILKLKNRFITNPVVQIKHAMSETKKISSRDDGGGLSLFWIVILLLLILWAVGFLFFTSIGSLIHVLLVIALVLLILWLLRII